MMIDIDHVSFQYSGAEQENLQDFNLQIKKGECVVLTGESGCGKTCVTRLINTLIPHFYEGEMSGAVLIDGVDTRTIQPHDLSDKIGSVFQNPRSQFFSLDTDSEIVFGMLNVWENIVLPVKLDGKKIEKGYVNEIIDTLGIRTKLENLPSALSGGQQQRVAIARALAAKPAILLADEPTGNLDSKTSQDVLGLLKVTSKRFHQTIVMITHNEEIAQMADRILQIEDGKIVSDSGLV